MKDILISDFSNVAFQNAFKKYFKEFGVEIKNWDDLFNELTEEGENKAYVRLDENGTSVGFILFKMIQLSDGFFEENLGFIREFWIAEEYRSKGYGSKLIRLAEEFFKENGICKSILTTDTAEHFYEEKLAEALNVSFQSISRWENNLAYPDISLIPAMANFFNVTTDILFDMNNEEHCKSKERYEEMYREYRKNGDLDLCKDAMLDARKQFPRDHHFMMNLAETMDLYEKGTKALKEEYISAKFSNQIYTLYPCFCKILSCKG